MVFPNLDLTAIAQSIAQAADEKCNGREVISVGPMTLLPAGAELHYSVVFVVPTLGNENYAGDQITLDTNRNDAGRRGRGAACKLKWDAKEN